MNPLTQIKNTQKASQREIAQGVGDSASWHAKFKHSAYVFAGGLSYDLTEGDLLAVFAQYGEIVDVNLVRDKDTGQDCMLFLTPPPPGPDPITSRIQPSARDCAQVLRGFASSPLHSCEVVTARLAGFCEAIPQLAVPHQSASDSIMTRISRHSAGKSRGFAFLAYEDQRSTVLAVDNLSGGKVAGRIITVNHVDNYKIKRAEVCPGRWLAASVRASVSCRTASRLPHDELGQHLQ